MAFKAKQHTYHYEQRNKGPIDTVYSLLCPVREKDWLDGWDYTMIYSRSGLIEKNCVFTTNPTGDKETVWHVTQHCRDEHKVEFIRVTPLENVVRINIQLKKSNEQSTRAFIDYQYTSLSEEQNKYMETQLESDFIASMQWWEKAINHYLSTDTKLLKNG